jgi:hypothetical protein
MEFEKLTRTEMILVYTKLLNESIKLYKEYEHIQEQNNELFKKYQANLAILRKLRKTIDEF